MIKFLQTALSGEGRSCLFIYRPDGEIIASIMKNKHGDLILTESGQFSLIGEKGELAPLNTDDPNALSNAKTLINLSQ